MVTKAANHSAGEPRRAPGQPSVTCLTHSVSRLPHPRCTWLAHTDHHSASGNLHQTREKGSRRQINGAAEAGWEELGSVGKSFSPPRHGSKTAVWCHPCYGGSAPCLAGTWSPLVSPKGSRNTTSIQGEKHWSKSLKQKPRENPRQSESPCSSH